MLGWCAKPIYIVIYRRGRLLYSGGSRTLSWKVVAGKCE